MSPDGGERITTWLGESSARAHLCHFLLGALPDAASIHIVGGALRDALMSPPREPKDFDVVVGGVLMERLHALPRAGRNFFGGANLSYEGLQVDLWPLEDTFHIKELGLPATIDGFLRGAPFNLDKIAYDLRERDLVDGGCLAGIAARTIAYAPERPYLEPVQALRCVLLRRKTGFALDDSARALLSRVAPIVENDPAAVAEMRRFLRFLKHVHDETMLADVIEEIESAELQRQTGGPRWATGAQLRTGR